MPKFDQNDAECHVFTFKEGALSALAHDLELAVRRFTIEVTDELAVDAKFEASSLAVLHAIKDGRPRDVSEGDKRKIERNIADDVLETRRHPEIRFRAAKAVPAGDGFVLAGELSLHGKTRPLEIKTRPANGKQVAEITLHQPDFGIKPFSAMLGTLKIKPDLKVRVSLTWPRA
ncbi:MAG: YceI family protein [Kofleriaceae bacterium]